MIKPRIVVVINEHGYVTEVMSDHDVEVMVVDQNHHLAEEEIEQGYEEDNEYQVVPLLRLEEATGPRFRGRLAVMRKIRATGDVENVTRFFEYAKDPKRIVAYFNKCVEYLKR